MMPSTRIQWLNETPASSRAKYVLYWMQQSQRTRFNHALELAVARANELAIPVVVCFGLTDNYPDANARHYAFMLQGLADVRRNLLKRGMQLVVRKGNPPQVAIDLARDAALVVCDRGYLRHQKAWRAKLAQACAKDDRPVIQVESDAVVPVEVASNRREYAARTIRPRIHKHLREHLVALPARNPSKSSLRLDLGDTLDVSDPDALLQTLQVDRSVAPVSDFFVGGENEAHRRLKAFIEHKLGGYDKCRNEPAAAHTSHLSPYLHFGHISPLEIALAATNSKAPRADREALVEELVVRRELAINYCHFTDNYDSCDALPGWAKRTLKDHQADPRPYVYTREQLASAATHDPFWNAAQRQMNATGFMHNYMRMYWGKKILEWSADPRQAFATTLWLNNRLFLCGRDCVSYAGVAWIYGLHDRPWGPAREIFGTVRYMNSAGLTRKFDMDAYLRWVGQLDGK